MAETTTHLSKILDDCLEQIQKGDLTLAGCLGRYPEHRDELSELLSLALDIGETPRLQLSQVEIGQGREQLLNQLPPRSQPRRWSWPFLSLVPARRYGMAWVLIVATVFSMVAGGGLVYAADGAVPGEALYAIDRAVEEVRLELTRDPAALVELQLALAAERMEEVNALAAQGDPAALNEALNGHRQSVSQVVQYVSDSTGTDGEAMGQQLDNFAGLGDGEPAGDQVQIHDRDRDGWCLPDAEEPHPVIEGIVETYEISPTLTYDMVLGWFCDGAGLGEIMIALNISQQTGIPVGDLLALRESGTGWGQILRDLELIGGPQQQGPPDEPGKPEGEPGRKPEDTGPWHEDPENPMGPGEGEPTQSENGGKPEDAGPPGEGSDGTEFDRPVGPPEDRPGGPAENPPVGPPENDPGEPADGPPEGSPGEPPEETPVGPPGNSPGDPPEDPPGNGGSGGSSGGSNH